MNKLNKVEIAESRLEHIFYARNVQKMRVSDIAKMFRISTRLVHRAIRIYSKYSGLDQGTAAGLIAFYENELREYIEKRKDSNPTQYIKLSHLVLEAQEKIAEVLNMVNRPANIDASTHNHFTWKVEHTEGDNGNGNGKNRLYSGLLEA